VKSGFSRGVGFQLRHPRSAGKDRFGTTCDQAVTLIMAKHFTDGIIEKLIGNVDCEALQETKVDLDYGSFVILARYLSSTLWFDICQILSSSLSSLVSHFRFSS
jgi:hypothetical protein